MLHLLICLCCPCGVIIRPWLKHKHWFVAINYLCTPLSWMQKVHLILGFCAAGTLFDAKSVQFINSVITKCLFSSSLFRNCVSSGVKKLIFTDKANAIFILEYKGGMQCTLIWFLYFQFIIFQEYLKCQI